MGTKYLLILLVAFSIIIFGCAQVAQTDVIEEKDAMTDKVITSSDNVEPGSLVHDVPKDTPVMTDKSGYTGKVLAGSETTKYLDFNKADYDKALKEKKKILLYFYANWCPICRVEQRSTFAAFNEIKDPDLIGFRVNYRDSDTDADEEELAKQFGVSYQHTKVILKDGQRVAKFPDSWGKERYLEELSKI